MMQRWYLASAVTASVLASPGLAADFTDAQLADPWEFYIGAHGGVVFGDGEWEDPADNEGDLEGDRAIFGGLAGVNHRLDTFFLGIEGDIGFATGEFDFDLFGSDFDGCGNGAWCDFNGHIRARAGASFDNLDIFIAGGLALADGEGGTSVIGESNDDTFVGWSIGAGFDYAITEMWKVRLEFLHDDYGGRDASSVPDYSSKWTDNTVRAAAIFAF